MGRVQAPRTDACSVPCLHRGAVALGLTEESIETLLEIFEDSKNINIISKNSNEYKIKMNNEIILSQALISPKYSEFVENLNTINEYKNKFMQKELV